MSDLDTLFKQIPIADIAKRLGVDEATATQGVAAALPALLQGLQANAEDPSGAASLAKALGAKDTSLVDGGISLADVDMKDGEKAVKHIFGSKSSDVASALGGLKGDASESLMSKLLPILAPIVLAFVAKKLLGSNSGNSGGGLGDILGSVLSGSGSGSNSGGGLSDILGGMLGGSSNGGSSSGGGGLGDILGDMLGGSSGGSSSGGGLSDILGGLLGGGSK